MCLPTASHKHIFLNTGGTCVPKVMGRSVQTDRFLHVVPSIAFISQEVL